ncbi:TolC family outer membrane protein [Kangiella sp. TOML190]|uniref:TolC family outer membrane protein n=1 Tax=Kangiella sp. TOML190 TaxID=2931351 RepID=UPI00204033BC|nr:TolC family outer membrane protein [Kangiella sp. TOML190]
MKKHLIALSLSLAFSSNFAAGAETVSLSNAGKTDLLNIYRQALQNDTQYKISAANLRASEQGVSISRSSLLPQISGSASRSKSDNDRDTVISGAAVLDGIQSGFDNDVNYTTNYRVQLNQSLFNWGNWVALDQAELRVRASELTHGANLQDLMSRSVQAYFNVLSAEENLTTTQAELETLGKQLDFIREQYESGLANATDFLNAQANYDQSVANEVTIKNTLSIAKESLRQLTNNYYVQLEGLGDEVDLKEPMPNNIDDWTRVAAQENLSLRAQQMNVKVAKKEIERNRSGHYPSLDLNLSYSDNDSDNNRLSIDGGGSSTSRTNSESDGYNAGITLSVPIFTGFRTSAQTEQARQNYLSSSHQHEQTARQVQASARNAFTALESAIASFRAYKRSLESNRSSLDATQEGYQAGIRNIIDVLTATRSYYNARRNLTRAKYDYLINGVNLKLAAGTLTEQDLETINQLLLKY